MHSMEGYHWGDPIDVDREQEAYAALDFAVSLIGKHLDRLWKLGDGDGGYIFREIEKEAERQGYIRPGEYLRQVNYRKKVPALLRRQVMERDEYRCIRCGTHIDLTLDHRIPVSLGGKTTFDNLDTMCRPCNSQKGATI